jgi:NifB/MoaA-like Fe-S oxidoreductase
MMLDAWQGVRRLLPVALAEPRHLTLVCGTLIHPILAELVQRLNTVENLQVDLIPVKNRLFGHEVTVSGLLAGEDVLDRLGEEQLGDTVVLPRIMFDRSGTMTLDDLTLNAMQTRLGRKVVLVDGVRDLGRLVA